CHPDSESELGIIWTLKNITILGLPNLSQGLHIVYWKDSQRYYLLFTNDRPRRARRLRTRGRLQTGLGGLSLGASARGGSQVATLWVSRGQPGAYRLSQAHRSTAS